MVPRAAIRGFVACLLVALPGIGLAQSGGTLSDSLASGPMSQANSAEVAASIAKLSGFLQIPEILDVMRQEGISYGAGLESDMFSGKEDGSWAASVAQIYDVAQTRSRFDRAFAAALSDDPATLAAGLDFFGSRLGKSIVGLEVSTRRAMLDPAVEDGAISVFASLKQSGAPRLAELERFAKVNDLIESNVMGALNANLAFYQGLSEGGGLQDGMTAEDMVGQVWEQEAALRSETTDWLYPFMAMAYQPLTDAEFADYIAFSETPAGTKLNAALFQAFEAVYTDVSKNLGRAVARQLQGQDI